MPDKRTKISGDTFEVYCCRFPYKRMVGFAIGMMQRGTWYAGQPIEMKEADPDGEMPTAFELKEEEAQGLIDELYKAGFRPSEGIGSIGQLEATQKHLEDMRNIAFKFIDLNK